jgi:hypothetical protein
VDVFSKLFFTLQHTAAAHSSSYGTHPQCQNLSTRASGRRSTCPPSCCQSGLCVKERAGHSLGRGDGDKSTFLSPSRLSQLPPTNTMCSAPISFPCQFDMPTQSVIIKMGRKASPVRSLSLRSIHGSSLSIREENVRRAWCRGRCRRRILGTI